MYFDIIKDFWKGFADSSKILVLGSLFREDIKLHKLFFKIIQYNFFMHMAPTIFVQIIFWLFGIRLHGILNIINYPINIFSALFHLLHYLDLVNIVSSHSQKTGKSVGALDMASLAITMSIYNLIIYLTTTLINLLLHDRLYLFAIVINLFILTIYHSFYCFNNLWQYKKIDMSFRIDMHEKLWPYYIGYAILSSILYLYTNIAVVLGLYNMYMSLLISLPFLIGIRYPPKDQKYPNINLIIFSYLTEFIFMLSKNIIGYFSG